MILRVAILEFIKQFAGDQVLNLPLVHSEELSQFNHTGSVAVQLRLCIAA